MTAPADAFEWSRLKASDLRALAARDAVVVMPVASTEQHGPHLATGVDTFLVTEVARRAVRKVADRLPLVLAPTLWCGLAEHHIAFGGTFSLSFPTYLAVLRDLTSALKRQGFRRILLINGHGGNRAGLDVAATELARDPGLPVVVGTYCMPGPSAVGILEDQAGVMHACEAETSMMLHLVPELVDTDRLADAHGTRNMTEEALFPQLRRWQSFAEFTPSGVIGDARKASAEKGEKLFELYSDHLAERLLSGTLWPPADA